MDLSINEMLKMQNTIYNHYGEPYNWDAYVPQNVRTYWLWMFAEAGEVADDLKKHALSELMQAGPSRAHMVEEFADTMMFFMNTMACMSITAEEFSLAYKTKFEYNMHRWEKKKQKDNENEKA